MIQSLVPVRAKTVNLVV